MWYVSSLRARLFFLICLATLPAVLFIFFVAQGERARVLARMQEDALHLADLASREHAHQIQGARELLSWLGQKVSREGLDSPILTDPTFLGTLVAGHPQLSNIGVLSPEGEVLVSAYPLATYRSWKDNPAYLAALRSDDVAVGTYLISPIFAQPTLNHAYAIRGADHRVLAVLFNGLNLDFLSKIGKNVTLPEGFALFIADREGRVLARAGHLHAQLVGHDVPRIPGIAGLAQLRRAGVAEVGGVRGTFVAAPLEGAPGLFVAVGLPYERAVGQANLTFYRTLATLGLLTLFVIAAVLTSAELGILRGLRSLARTAQRLGAGDLSVRASIPRTYDEFASLATTFNAMADSLAARHRDAVDAQERLRALTSRLQAAREQEATRISRELHDEVGQMLTALKIDLLRLRVCCPGEHPPPCATTLGEGTTRMGQQVDAAIGFVRRISSDLRPGVLDRLGLIAALEWLARETEARTGLAIQVEADLVAEALDERLSVTLFRIAQEALNNVIRHAQASVVDIDLGRREEDVVLTIHDNGTGISDAAVESNTSLGIIGMCERAALVNGRVTVLGSPGQGTTVSVIAPLHPNGEDDLNAHPAS